MAIKAAFFDIDGTLVSFQTHKIPASTIKTIEQIKERGVKIFISTGRPVAIINNIDAIRHLIDGYITFNGARTFINDEDITLMPIPENEVQAMIEDASRRDYAVLVCGKDDVALHNHKPIFDEIFVHFLVWQQRRRYALQCRIVFQHDGIQVLPISPYKVQIKVQHYVS